jgi:CDP-paratose 2-epimerase
VRILVTGACGFVGSNLVRAWLERGMGHTFLGVDNLIRPGSELNRPELRRRGVVVLHADLRCASDFETWPDADVVIDAAANPSVLAGVDGVTSSRQLVEHNLVGTINILEYCRQRRAAFVLLSTSRVYSILPLAALPVRIVGDAFVPDERRALPPGVTSTGVSERFATSAPVSLYGATKLASEQLALEYGLTYGFPVWINRCGVLAGAGQFGRPDQGIFAYWINAWLQRRPLAYFGFGGKGCQVRDCLHPADLVPLLERQVASSAADMRSASAIFNVSGGAASAMSLRQLSDWCRDRLGEHRVEASTEPRRFDVPWMVLDSTAAGEQWQWRPATPPQQILDEIVRHAEAHPDWLDVSAQA